MRKKLLIGLAVCITVFSLSTGVVSAKGKGKDLGDKIFKKMHLALEEKEDLKLSDSQIDQILNLKVKTKKDCIMKKAEIKTLLLDLKVQLMEDNIDMGKVNPIIDKKYGLKKEKAKSLLKAYASFKDILSKEQMDKLKEIYKQKCSMKSYGEKKEMMNKKMMERKHQRMDMPSRY
ncbi:MAG: hypothetical protein K9L58_00445 [Candidatus Omnitrophica bacterium]|jgi:hypothetical protein|nr:hypothetical protein [Candidatus Omnitrophota bacterium]MCF7892092.1 hypothetical protein [Candidatus Omnitrophota bacterium]MCF7895923.1 hypothetical protein [Candidatus Omnitrophota bacterium]MCF7908977.1 hypothetical protein [Candidatus Omnitrophota bacterium]